MFGKQNCENGQKWIGKLGQWVSGDFTTGSSDFNESFIPSLMLSEASEPIQNKTKEYPALQNHIIEVESDEMYVFVAILLVDPLFHLAADYIGKHVKTLEI
ncbi:hypothetical protein HHI36_016499 [Cryptolaemus montrouzieri]|uniref:Uncharacterized protein n=1 Tax=Cryptolaemus montrouzieri TaxID=559131 RepID=A0ABD2NKP6_9CUCU